MTCLKVIHCHNIAGVATTLAKYQRRLGVDAEVIAKRKHPFGFEEKVMGNLSGFLYLTSADVIHYHWTSWFEQLPGIGVRNPDARLFSALGKRIVLHYHGDDLRRHLVHNRIKAYRTLVSTPDLLRYLKDAEWLPNPVDLELFTPSGDNGGSVYKVGYYDPPQRDEYVPKGAIEDAVKTLRKEGLSVETAPARSLSYDKMSEYYHTLTIWVDKLYGGFYGLMACEAAASGKCVIASTNNIQPYIHEKPFFEFTGNLVDDIRFLLENSEERLKSAQKGRGFVQTRHDPLQCAQKTIDIYSKDEDEKSDK
jgi:glycosyltransferase involved in cell wall biosynthesis